MLQRLIELVKHPETLSIAASLSDPFERQIYVAGFAFSLWGWFQKRTNKPFNPLLGETYEIQT